MSKESVEAILGKENVEVFRKLQAETEAFANYIANYIMEEMARGNTTVDKWMVMDAISSFKGGAR